MKWHRVLAADELPEGRVTTVAAGHKSVALVHYDGQFSALDNHCPHQGGPLGEGSIENGLLRCPWHGFDYCPLDGKSPGFDDEAITYPLEIRDGEVFIGVQEDTHVATVTDLMAETMVNWGVEHVFGMVGHSNLGLADALRRQEEAGKLTYIGIRHEGAAAFAASAYGKLTGRPAACLTIAGPGRHQPAHRPVGREGRPRAGARAHRPGRHAGARPGRVPGGRPERRVRLGRRWSQPVLHDSNPVELMNLACKNALLRRDVAHLIFPDEVQTLPAPEARRRAGRGARLARPRSRRRRSRSPTRWSCCAARSGR
jgi:nitrite reductase/ring-hydroxylating ferredoxin subunit